MTQTDADALCADLDFEEFRYEDEEPLKPPAVTDPAPVQAPLQNPVQPPPPFEAVQAPLRPVVVVAHVPPVNAGVLNAGAPLPPVRTFNIDDGHWAFATYASGTMRNKATPATLTFLTKAISDGNRWDSSIIPIQAPAEQQVVDNLVVPNDGGADEDGDDEEEFGMDGLEEPALDMLSVPVMHMFTDHFGHLGITRVSHIGDLFERSGGTVKLCTERNNLLFYAKPIAGGRPSIRNRCHATEFLANGKHNPAYWRGQLIYRQYTANQAASKGRTCMAVMDIAAKTPQMLIPTNERGAHFEAIETYQNHGTLMNPQGHLHLSLFDGVAQSFVRFMNSEICVLARKAKWEPLFALTNVVHAKCGPYGTNGTRLASCDYSGGASFISLIGFFKQGSNDPNDFNAFSILNQGRPLGSRMLRNNAADYHDNLQQALQDNANHAQVNNAQNV